MNTLRLLVAIAVTAAVVGTAGQARAAGKSRLACPFLAMEQPAVKATGKTTGKASDNANNKAAAKGSGKSTGKDGDDDAQKATAKDKATPKSTTRRSATPATKPAQDVKTRAGDTVAWARHNRGSSRRPPDATAARGFGITGCSPPITSSGPPSRHSPSETLSSGAMPRSADMRRAEMPPATAATHATNRALTTPRDAKGQTHGWMMVPGWVRGKWTPQGMNCDLEVMLDHLDHICQIAGNADHIGIGSDLDIAFGREQAPHDLETIADLGRVPAMLAKRGYSAADIEKVMHGNWLTFLRKAWA